MRIADWITRARFRWSGDCGWACDWDEDYGFVPEADCPVHDPRTDPLDDIVFLLSTINVKLDSIERKINQRKTSPKTTIFNEASTVDFNEWAQQFKCDLSWGLATPCGERTRPDVTDRGE